LKYFEISFRLKNNLKLKIQNLTQEKKNIEAKV